MHLDHDLANDAAARQRRLQLWVNLASYHTFTATVNMTEAMIWDDLSGFEDRRAGGRGKLTGRAVEVFSPFSADLIARTTKDKAVLIATRRIAGPNEHYANVIVGKNPQMASWFRGEAWYLSETARGWR